MKGTFFRNGIEYRIVTDGESWSQGDRVSGYLEVKTSVGTSPAPARVALVHGVLKKVRTKAGDAFEWLQEKTIDGSGKWEFRTGRNSPITDATSSLFLLYGGTEPVGEGSSLGQLQLSLKPDPVIQVFLDVLQARFRFVLKALKATKDGMQAKLTPPSAQSLSMIEQVLLSFVFDSDAVDAALNIGYEFYVKSYDASAGSVDLKKKKKKREVSFAASQYRTSSNRIDDERFEMEIKAAIDEATSGFLG